MKLTAALIFPLTRRLTSDLMSTLGAGVAGAVIFNDGDYLVFNDGLAVSFRGV